MSAKFSLFSSFLLVAGLTALEFDLSSDLDLLKNGQKGSGFAQNASLASGQNQSLPKENKRRNPLEFDLSRNQDLLLDGTDGSGFKSLKVTSHKANKTNNFSTSMRPKSGLSAELGGVSYTASLQFSNFRSENILINFGIGHTYVDEISSSLTQPTIRKSVISVPLSLSFVIGSKHLLELGGGLLFNFPYGDLDNTLKYDEKLPDLVNLLFNSPVMGQALLGYRYWPDKTGVFFRATGYLFLGFLSETSLVYQYGQLTEVESITPKIAAWVGVSLGIAF